MKQILRVGAIVDREARVEADLRGMQAQEPRADRVEGAAPRQSRRGLGRGEAERVVEHAADAPLHLGGGATREGEHQDPRRIDAREHEPADARRQGQRLARAGARDDQQRAGDLAGRRIVEPEAGGGGAGRR